jgi:hypothetical protein
LFRDGPQAESLRDDSRRGRPQRFPVGEQHQRQIVRGGANQIPQPGGVFVTVDVEPEVGDVIASQKRLDLVAALGPTMTDDADIDLLISVVSPPVVEEIVDARVEALLSGIPRLHEIAVEADVVYRPDGRFCIRVGGEQHQLGIGDQPARLVEELDARHPRHALIRDDQRNRTTPHRELLERVEGLLPRRGADDPVVGAVPATEIASHCLRH